MKLTPQRSSPPLRSPEQRRGDPEPLRKASGSRVSTRTVLVVGVVVTLLLAGVVSLWASASPDGLARVAEDLGFAGTERRHATAGGPLAGYDVAGLDARWSGGLAGVVGCLVVLASTSALMLVRRRATLRRTDGGE